MQNQKLAKPTLTIDKFKPIYLIEIHLLHDRAVGESKVRNK